MTRVIRLPEVLRRLGISKPTLYRGVRAGHYPAPLKIGPRCSGWDEAEIDGCIERARAARDRQREAA